jgi:hypothetical protein
MNSPRANQRQQQLIDKQQLLALSFADAGWPWDAWGPWSTTVTETEFVYAPVGW